MDEIKDSTPETVRSFLALTVDQASIDFLDDALTGQLRHYSGFRRIPPVDWHVTLHFLGNQSTDLLERLAGAIDVLSPGLTAPGTFPLARLGLFPHPTHGNLIVAEGMATAAMAQWHEGLAHCLGELGLPVENRPWRPHISLARRRLHRSRRPATTADLKLDWTVQLQAISLMKSELSDSPARYQALKTWTP